MDDEEDDDLFVFLQGRDEKFGDDEDAPATTETPLSKESTLTSGAPASHLPGYCLLPTAAVGEVSEMHRREAATTHAPLFPSVAVLPHHHHHHPRSQSESAAASFDAYSLCNYSSSSSSLFDDLELISQSADSQSVQLMETLLMQQLSPIGQTRRTTTTTSNYSSHSAQQHSTTDNLLPQLTADVVESELELEETDCEHGAVATQKGRHICLGVCPTGGGAQQEKEEPHISSTSFTSPYYSPITAGVHVVGVGSIQGKGTTSSSRSSVSGGGGGAVVEHTMHSPCPSPSNETETTHTHSLLPFDSSSNQTSDDVTTVLLCSAINKCCQLDNRQQVQLIQQPQGGSSTCTSAAAGSSVHVRRLLIDKLHRMRRRRIHSDPTRPPSRSLLHPYPRVMSPAPPPSPFTTQVRCSTPSLSLPTSSSPLCCSSPSCICASSPHCPRHTNISSLSTQVDWQEEKITTASAPIYDSSDDIHLSGGRGHRRGIGGSSGCGSGLSSAAAAAMIQKRKERNRVSAAKCRDKQKKRYHNLETEKLSLTRDNEALMKEVELLERERRQLENMVVTHSDTCCTPLSTHPHAHAHPTQSPQAESEAEGGQEEPGVQQLLPTLPYSIPSLRPPPPAFQLPSITTSPLITSQSDNDDTVMSRDGQNDDSQ